MDYTVYESIKGKATHCADFDVAVVVAKQILRKTPTRNGFVAPVSIWHDGVMIAILSDDANGITMHRLA